MREGRFSEGGRTSYLEKENIKLEACGLPEWDRSDPVHAGLQKVELVSGAAGVLVRRTPYREPVSGVE